MKEEAWRQWLIASNVYTDGYFKALKTSSHGKAFSFAWDAAMKEQNEIANAIIRAAELLGNNGAATSMGALETLGKTHLDSMQMIANALNNIAMALERMTDTVEELSDRGPI